MSIISHALSPLKLSMTDNYQAANSDDDDVIASNGDSAYRSLDDYLQTAYDSTSARSSSTAQFDQSSPPLTVSSVLKQIRSQWKYMLIITALGISSAADAAEMFTIGYVLGDPGFQEEILRGDLATGGALVAGILNLGLIFGGISAGSSEGRLGRRYIMLGGLLLTSVAGFGCAVVPNVALFALCRFAAGLGIGPVLASTAPLATELSPPKERGFVVSVANSFWTVGLIANAIWAYIVFGMLALSWRVFVIICTLPSVVGCVLIWWLVPESPRFLALQGQYDRAARSANRVALSMGYRGVLLLDTEIEHQFTSGRRPSQIIRHPITLKEKLRQGMDKIRQVTNKDLRRPTLIIMTLWIAASTGGSIGQWLVEIYRRIRVQNLYLNFIFLNCACIPGNIASAVLTDRIGRNKFFTSAMMLSSLALFGTSGVVLSAGDDLAARTGGIVFCTAIFYASMTGLYTCLYVMAAELFPTNVRSTGVALCSTFGRIASVLAMYLNGALVDTPAMLLAVGGTVLMVGSITSLVFPPNEMKLKPVLDHEGTSDDDEFEGEQQPSIVLEQQNVSAASDDNIRGRRSSELKYLAG
mmetsp:Transcript_14032/g.30483  ORF Transcript_14032/g.30483 Transcript_14032/m.30483 type:complete len:584 (+) Transcript_14032:214-1965(+)